MRSLDELKADLAKRRGHSSGSGPDIVNPGVQEVSKERDAKQNVKMEENDKRAQNQLPSGDAGATLLQMIKGNPNIPPFPSTGNVDRNSKPGSRVQILELAPALLQEPPFSKPQPVAPQEKPYNTNITMTWSRDQLLSWRPEEGLLHDRNLLPQALFLAHEDQQLQAESKSDILAFAGRSSAEELAGNFKLQQDHMVSVEVLEEAFEEAFTFSSDEEDVPKLSLGFRKWFNRESSTSSQDNAALPIEALAAVSTDAGSGEETTDEDEAGSQKCVLDSPDSCQKPGARSIVHLHALLSEAAQQS